MKNKLVNQRKRSNCLVILTLVIGVVTFTLKSLAGTSSNQMKPKQDTMQYIYKNIQYPHEAVEKRIEGLVTVSFHVNKNESTCSSTESEKSSFKDNVIQMAISHFSLSYSLYDENNVFEVSYADTVFARNLKKEKMIIRSYS